jgi:hypothetical protein
MKTHQIAEGAIFTPSLPMAKTALILTRVIIRMARGYLVFC